MRKVKPVAIAVHLSINLGCLVLFVLRTVHISNPAVVVINREITSHISNFALSLVLCALAGFVLLATGKRLALAQKVCIAVLAANVVYEAFLPVLNTRDMMDALYGIAGSLAGMLYLAWLNRFGFCE